VAWSKAKDFPDAFQTFKLRIGDGNAGRAYKTRTVRLFDKEQAGTDPKASAYVPVSGIPHRFMLSIPLLDPLSQSPLAVLNVGTTDVTQAAMFRSLNSADLHQLVTKLQMEPLARLAEVAGLRLEPSTPAKG
jgi:hypothetical protein